MSCISHVGKSNQEFQIYSTHLMGEYSFSNIILKWSLLNLGESLCQRPILGEKQEKSSEILSSSHISTIY